MSLDLFKRKKKSATENWNAKTMFGSGLTFVVSEAYKLLRTNIQFSFSDEGTGHVIGVTSSIQSEGKSSSISNLAYAMAEDGERVLLLDADLRRPSIASKLGLARSPGLTNLLVSRGDYREVVQHCSAAPKLDVICAGDIPPNPSELLGSNRMAKLLEELRQNYDYILVDLPPVTVVSDAIAMSKVLDGVVVVVRNAVAEQKMLADAIRQLKMVNVHILGFVYRDTQRVSGGYGSKYGRRYKYYNYYRSYGESVKSGSRSHKAPRKQKKPEGTAE